MKLISTQTTFTHIVIQGGEKYKRVRIVNLVQWYWYNGYTGEFELVDNAAYADLETAFTFAKR